MHTKKFIHSVPTHPTHSKTKTYLIYVTKKQKEATNDGRCLIEYVREMAAVRKLTKREFYSKNTTQKRISDVMKQKRKCFSLSVQTKRLVDVCVNSRERKIRGKFFFSLTICILQYVQY